MSTLAKAIARHKVAQAAVAAACGPEDLPEHLLDAEWDALSDLAETPCANDAERLEKLRYLLAHEIMLKCGAFPTIGQEGGSVLVALACYFKKRGRAKPKSRAA